jgi:hypothetical protein
MPYGRSHTSISTRAIGCGSIVENSNNGKKNRVQTMIYQQIVLEIFQAILQLR